MVFTNKLLAHRGEKRIATYTMHVHDVNHTTSLHYCRSCISAVDQGQGAEIFSTAPEVDSPKKIYAYQLECWNIIIIIM